MDVYLKGTQGNYFFDPENAGNRLGQGGMGVVFKGYETETKVPVAIKVLYKEIAPNFQAVERERQSASIRIQHRNLIKMLDFVEVGGIFHIISEFTEGIPIHDYLLELQQKGQRLSTSQAISIINQALDGLEALHKNNPPIIHRDIDPSNIMICSDETVKIMDFGIAKISDGKRKSLTGMGTVIGKPHYSPPEQIRGENDRINPSTDIYALGITFYEMLTGTPPFNATNEYDVMKMQIEKPLPNNTLIPVEIFRVIQKATEKLQNRRFQSVAEFRQALANLNNAKIDPVVKPTGDAGVWQKRTLIAGLAALLFLILFIWSFSKGGKTGGGSQVHPIDISKIEFANTTNDGSIITDFGQDLYSERMRYIAPKIYFQNNSGNVNTVSLFIKYVYQPDTKNSLLTNTSFTNSGYSFLKKFSTIEDLNTGTSSNGATALPGFGDGRKSIFVSGQYKCEVWYFDELLYSQNFYIK